MKVRFDKIGYQRSAKPHADTDPAPAPAPIACTAIRAHETEERRGQ
jgi:hypothetical protein